MAKKKVCDFCLSEGRGIFNRLETLPDGHHICKDCKQLIRKYDLPLKYDLFQTLVTAQPNMKDMIMDAYLENNDANEALAKHYPFPAILMHAGEHCINVVDASITVDESMIPDIPAVRSIQAVQKGSINNIRDASGNEKTEVISGKLYETEAALYFLSSYIVNCHRLGYMKRNTGDTEHVVVVTPTKHFTYTIKNADLFFLRERFYQKVNAARHNKDKHLIYITNDNQVRITPGVYDIPKALRPGIYKVKAIKDAGLHIKDPLGRVRDYYENEEHIDLRDGGVLECTGEYQLQWIGEQEEE